MTVRIAALVLALVAGEALVLSGQTASPLGPTRLDKYLTSVGISPADRMALASGKPVKKLLDVDETREVAVLGAVWINAPVRRYVTAITDIETFERGGGFKITKKISTTPQPSDFAQLRLPADDVKDLRECRIGSCAVKLGARALQRFQSEVDWKGDAQGSADRVMRQLMLEYAQGYLEGGNERLAVYRDNDPQTFVAEEFRAMTSQMPELTTYMPDVRRYLLEYPKASLPDATSFLYWQEAEFGLKPTIRLSHFTISERPEATVVASKMLYASHYFWTGLELRVLLPDPARGPGFWFIMVNRSRADGLDGFTGRVVRGRVQNGVQEAIVSGLLTTKRRLEGGGAN